MKTLYARLILAAVFSLCLVSMAQASPAIRFEGPRQIHAGQSAAYNVIIQDQVGLSRYELRLDSGQTVSGTISGKTFILREIPLDTHAASTRLVRVRVMGSNGQWTNWSEYRPVVVGSSNDIPRVQVNGPVGVNVGQQYPLTYMVRANQRPRAINIRNPFTGQVMTTSAGGTNFDRTMFIETTGRTPGSYVVQVRAQGHTGQWSPWASQRFTLHPAGGANQIAITISAHDAVIRGNTYAGQFSVRSSEGLRLMQIRDPFSGRISSIPSRGTTFTRQFSYATGNVNPGNYHLSARVQTLSGSWSGWERKDFRVNAPTPSAPSLVLSGPNSVVQTMPYTLSVRIYSGGSARRLQVRDPFTRQVQTMGGLNARSTLSMRFDTTRRRTGTYTVEVRGEGPTGQWGDWARRSFRVVGRGGTNELPVVTIDSAPDISRGGTLALTFTVQCVQNVRQVEIGNPFTNRTSTINGSGRHYTQTVRISSDNARVGLYTVRVRASNSGGNWGNWVTRTFRVR